MRLLVFALILFNSNTFYAQDNWVLEKTESDIKAYSRIKEGTDYYEFRTIFKVKASILDAKKLITNVAHFENWLPSTKSSKLLKKVNDNVYYGYTVTEMPWPMSDRDLVFKSTTKKLGPKKYSITLIGTPDYIAEDAKKVRVKEYKAKWIIKEMEPNIIKVYYQASFNPDSSYPNWMIKNSMIDARIETSLNFRAQLLGKD